MQLSTAMLRVRMLSGEEVASVPVVEVIDVRIIEAAADWSAWHAKSIQTKAVFLWQSSR